MYKEFFEFIKSKQKTAIKNMTVESDPVEVRIYLEQSKILESIAVIEQLTSNKENFEKQLKFVPSQAVDENSQFPFKVEQLMQRQPKEKKLSVKEKQVPTIERVEKTADVHRFERRLVGGYLPTLDAEVSEATIRNQGIQHGDLVKVYTMGKSTAGKERYACWLEEEKNCEPPKDRVQFNNCLVEVQASRLICRKSKNKLLQLNDEIFSMLISDEEARTFSLKPGDIVDVAVSTKDLKAARVIWKHAIQSKANLDAKTGSKSKKTKREKKQKDKSSLTLKGKKILVVSTKNDRSRYEGEIAKRGGHLLMGDSDLLVNQMNALVSKADLVIVVTSKCSHDAMFSSKATAKALKIPVVFAKSDGTTGIIHLAEQIFEPVEVSP